MSKDSAENQIQTMQQLYVLRKRNFFLSLGGVFFLYVPITGTAATITTLELGIWFAHQDAGRCGQMLLITYRCTPECCKIVSLHAYAGRWLKSSESQKTGGHRPVTLKPLAFFSSNESQGHRQARKARAE